MKVKNLKKKFIMAAFDVAQNSYGATQPGHLIFWDIVNTLV